MMAVFPGLFLMLFLWLPSQPSGQPTKPADVYRYVAPRADVVLALDVGSLGGSAMRKLSALANEPFVSGSAKLSRLHATLLRQINGQLQMVRTFSGVDPLRDLNWITISARMTGRRPRMLAAASGNVTLAAIQRLAQRSGAGPAKRLARGTMYIARGGKGAFGFARGNVAMIGDVELVRDALSGKRGGPVRSMAMRVHDSKSFFTFAVDPTSRRARRALKRMSRGFLHSLFGRFDGFAASMRYDGLRVGLRAKGGGVVTRYSKLLDGLGHYMIAAEHFLRGSMMFGDGLLSPKDARFMPRGLRGLASAKPALLRYLRKHIALAQSPSHSVSRRGRVALLDYKGSRHAGLLPVLFGAGFWFASARSSTRALRGPVGVIAPPPAMAQPRTKAAPRP
ncbi:MAG: hypothetical protein KC503_41385 [Myxococcales bacterium]|nr:hypothetical protein [Myxococcales bacterium]